jgi:hypothetical protein
MYDCEVSVLFLSYSINDVNATPSSARSRAPNPLLRPSLSYVRGGEDPLMKRDSGIWAGVARIADVPEVRSECRLRTRRHATSGGIE